MAYRACLIALAVLTVAWLGFTAYVNVVATFDRAEDILTCTHFVEEDGSASPVLTDFDGRRCLIQRGIDPEGWPAQD